MRPSKLPGAFKGEADCGARDIGEGGYQVGNFPPLFAEWNDHFRDAVRRFWLTRDLSLGSLPVALPAPAIFKRDGKRPSATINR